VAQELKRWPLRGATQGVAVGEKWFYVIDDTRLARHEKQTGEFLNEWKDPPGGTIRHLNSGIVQDGLLVCSHSNFPDLPTTNSLESFDLMTLQPVKSVSVTGEPGSLVWAERRDGFWWACFANYDPPLGASGRDHRDTLFAKLDDQFRLVQSWHFPARVLQKFKPWSCSGGSWGDDGLLYVTGHDAKELYVLRVPKSGSVLEFVTTIEVPFEGQAWSWDRSQERVLYAVSRKTSEVVMAFLPKEPAGR
jgi:hypothetical protein